ncbi:MAG: hypothetical protein FJ087_12465 [Deltaproteobacteria bacterium]|nr:hypothetical protein [Deltaproteobacteria bacterium]
MRLDEQQFAFLYLLLEARERGEYVPLSMMRMQLHEDLGDERVVALSLENMGLVECSVDERLVGNARYKYKLTPVGFDLVCDILRAPVARVQHTVRRPR